MFFFCTFPVFSMFGKMSIRIPYSAHAVAKLCHCANYKVPSERHSLLHNCFNIKIPH